MKLFHSNTHSSDVEDLTLVTKVYGEKIELNLNLLGDLFGFRRATNPVTIPPYDSQMNRIKQEMTERLCGVRTSDWNVLDYKLIPQQDKVLNLIVSYNLLQTNHNNEMR